MCGHNDVFKVRRKLEVGLGSTQFLRFLLPNNIPVCGVASSASEALPDVHGWPTVCLASPVGSSNIKTMLGREKSFPRR